VFIVDDWPLIGSPLPLVAIFCAYVVLVFVALPRFMRHRDAFDLRFVMRTYNIIQVFTCCYFIKVLHTNGLRFENMWKCIHDDGSRTNTAHYHFIFLRMFEFLETIFFVLRKKQKQVSLLHVYHHISTVALLYLFLKYSGGVMGVYLGFVNSAVHIVMYSYYFLSSFVTYKRFTTYIKPYITKLQITQLILLLGQCVAAVMCDVPKHIQAMYVVQAFNIVLLLIMFIAFHAKQ